MCRAIERTARVGLFAAILATLFGCVMNPIIGPGYAISISVENVRFKEDIEFLDRTVANEGFGGRYVSSSPGKWKCVHYDRQLDGAKYQHLQKSKFISLGYCYDFGAALPDTKRQMKHFYIDISNDAAGQDAAIKQEIDRLGEVFYKDFVNRFGKENVKVERRRTNLPF